MIFNIASTVSGDNVVNQLFPNIPTLIAHVFATVILILVL